MQWTPPLHPPEPSAAERPIPQQPVERVTVAIGTSSMTAEAAPLAAAMAAAAARLPNDFRRRCRGVSIPTHGATARRAHRRRCTSARLVAPASSALPLLCCSHSGTAAELLPTPTQPWASQEAEWPETHRWVHRASCADSRSRGRAPMLDAALHRLSRCCTAGCLRRRCSHTRALAGCARADDQAVASDPSVARRM